MSYLKFGDFLLTSDQVMGQLVQYELIDPFLEHLALDRVLPQLTESEVFEWLTGSSAAERPAEFETTKALSQWAAQHQLQPYQVQIRIRRQRIHKLKQIQFDPQVEAAFLQNKFRFEQIVYSRIQTQSEAFAEELLFQIRDDGDEFALVAAQHSEIIGDRPAGGRVGPVRTATLLPQVAEVLQSSAVGQLHVIAVQDRFWIVRLEQRIEAHLTEVVRSEIRDWLFSTWIKSFVQNWQAIISDTL